MWFKARSKPSEPYRLVNLDAVREVRLSKLDNGNVGVVAEMREGPSITLASFERKENAEIMIERLEQVLGASSELSLQKLCHS